MRTTRTMHVRTAGTNARTVGTPANLASLVPEAMSLRQARSTGIDGPYPTLLTVNEVAALLRTTRKAIYTMTERALLPGVTRIGHRLLFRHDLLLDWLGQKSLPSLER